MIPSLPQSNQFDLVATNRLKSKRGLPKMEGPSREAGVGIEPTSTTVQGRYITNLPPSHSAPRPKKAGRLRDSTLACAMTTQEKILVDLE